MFRHTDAIGSFSRFDSATNWSSTASPIQSLPFLLLRLIWTPSKPSSLANATQAGSPSRRRFQSVAPILNFAGCPAARRPARAASSPAAAVAPAARNSRRLLMRSPSHRQDDLPDSPVFQDDAMRLGGVRQRQLASDERFQRAAGERALEAGVDLPVLVGRRGPQRGA